MPGLFPDTTIKQGSRPLGYLRTGSEVEIVGHAGGLLSVGRGGSLTGNRVDCLILDDLYKNAMEGDSPRIRESCWEWYVSVVRTRLHNASRELVVFTRWHEEDLIGELRRRETVRELTAWSQLDGHPPEEWLHLNFEAIRTGAPMEIDRRAPGEALWGERQSGELLARRRALDPLRFECMYQGRPTVRRGCSTAIVWRFTTGCPSASSAGPTTPTRPIRAMITSVRSAMRSIPTA